LNRRRAAAAIGAELGDLTFASRCTGPGSPWSAGPSGPRIAVGRGLDRGRRALITSEAGPVLAVMAADCVPLVLFDPARRVLATVPPAGGHRSR